MHFAVTKITYTMEDKIDLVIILYVLMVINRHYKEVKGIYVERRLAREREIMSSECWDSEIDSNRSGSVVSRTSTGVSHSSSIAGQKD